MITRPRLTEEQNQYCVFANRKVENVLRYENQGKALKMLASVGTLIVNWKLRHEITLQMR